MNAKERIKAAMDLSPVDKTPLMCQFSIGHMLLQLKVSPVEFWFDPIVFADGLIEMRELYDFDGILVSLHGHNPMWKNEASKIYSADEGEVVEWKNGDKTICPNNDLPFYKYMVPKQKLDIDNLIVDNLPVELNYIPVSQNLYFEIMKENKFLSIERVVQKCGNSFSIHGEITSPFDYFLDLVGTQDGLMALLINPDNCKLILSHYTELIKRLAVEMCSTGIDAIKISSPFAGSSFISPTDYEEFVLPYEKEIAAAINGEGIHVYTHTCGSINDRLEMMFEAGISGIECLDPPPIGNVELEDAIARVNDKGFIKGNIDSVNLLLRGSKEEIILDTEKRIKLGANARGFILSTACSIAPEVTRENIMVLRETINKTYS
jgi:uroporphyrinogen decarboxylase